MPKAPSSTPMVSIQRPCYAMASTDGQSADITMYGQIVDTQPTDWWTGEPIPGQYIIESEFLSDLQQVEHCSEITIRMDSVGGDAGVSILIHNRLRELAAKGTKLTCIVDGVAMSGGSLIMCACDTVKANPSKPRDDSQVLALIWGNYNADELRKAADANDAWDKSQVSIYKRKTGLSETVLLHMMSDTTYMTGKEAVEKGFANELLDDAEPVEISASADRQTIYAKGHALHLRPGTKLPGNIPMAKAAAPATATANTPAAPAAQSNEGGHTTMATTIEELRKENPELCRQLEQSASEQASQNERTRLSEIDEVANLFDPTMVQEPSTARPLAMPASWLSALPRRSCAGPRVPEESGGRQSGIRCPGVEAVPGASATGDPESCPMQRAMHPRPRLNAWLRLMLPSLRCLTGTRKSKEEHYND